MDVYMHMQQAEPQNDTGIREKERSQKVGGCQDACRIYIRPSVVSPRTYQARQETGLKFIVEIYFVR